MVGKFFAPIPPKPRETGRLPFVLLSRPDAPRRRDRRRCPIHSRPQSDRGPGHPDLHVAGQGAVHHRGHRAIHRRAVTANQGCGIRGTNTLQINGILEGVYTLVLLDGVPLLGGLASAYALDGILGMIQQVEVIQGLRAPGLAARRWAASSTSSSPIRPGWPASATLDTHGRLLVSANSAFARRGALANRSGRATVHHPHRRQRRRLHRHAHRGTRCLTLRKQHRSGSAVGAPPPHLRRGTVRRRPRFPGSRPRLDTRYGERDLLRIEGVTGSSPLRSGWRPGGAAYHRQQSTYGTTNFNAEEWTTNVDAFHSGWAVGERGRFTGGASLLGPLHRRDPGRLRHERLGAGRLCGMQRHPPVSATLDVDSRPAHRAPVGPGVDRRPVSTGGAPAPTLDGPFNAGRGYRRVHLFIEEHAALDGPRNVIQPATGLDPESVECPGRRLADRRPHASMTVSARPSAPCSPTASTPTTTACPTPSSTATSTARAGAAASGWTSNGCTATAGAPRRPPASN